MWTVVKNTRTSDLHRIWGVFLVSSEAGKQGVFPEYKYRSYTRKTFDRLEEMHIGVWANFPLLRFSLFWDITHPSIADSYRRFGLTYRSQLQGSSSPRRLSLSIIPKESRSHLHLGGFLKYPLYIYIYIYISDFNRYFKLQTDFYDLQIWTCVEISSRFWISYVTRRN